MKQPIALAVVLIALLASGCEQCLIRPCGFCYDSIVSAAVRAPRLEEPAPSGATARTTSDAARDSTRLAF